MPRGASRLLGGGSFAQRPNEKEADVARTITCDCGDVLTGEDDEQLVHAIRRHDVLVHAGSVGMTDEQIREQIRTKAQDAPAS